MSGARSLPPRSHCRLELSVDKRLSTRKNHAPARSISVGTIPLSIINS